MTKYEVKAVVCDYGIFENGELRLVINSQSNALLIKYVLEQDLKHKVVIKGLLEAKTKPKRKLRAMTVKEYCDKTNCKKCSYCVGSVFCEYMRINGIAQMKTSITPYKTIDSKYILREVKL